jgi:hypothetical protein
MPLCHFRARPCEKIERLQQTQVSWPGLIGPSSEKYKYYSVLMDGRVKPVKPGFL